MCHYWLYILKHELLAEGCTLALSSSALDPNWKMGKLQTKNYRSWEELSIALTQAGIEPEIIRSSKAALDSDGLHTLWDVDLSEEQLRTLGFHGIPADPMKGNQA